MFGKVKVFFNTEVVGNLAREDGLDIESHFLCVRVKGILLETNGVEFLLDFKELEVVQIPKLLKNAIQRIEYSESFRSEVRRTIGIYRLGKTTGRIEFSWDAYSAATEYDRDEDEQGIKGHTSPSFVPPFAYSLTITGNNLHTVRRLRRLMRSGKLTPVSNWEEEQLVVSTR